MASPFVTKPPPRSAPRPSPSAFSTLGGFWSRIASASSTSSRASRLTSSPGGSGVEELDIVLLPGDPNPLSLAAAQQRVLLRGDLGKHPLAAGEQVELDEVAK